jgi:23S rRNA A2030 N6-methylase RlmJ
MPALPPLEERPDTMVDPRYERKPKKKKTVMACDSRHRLPGFRDPLTMELSLR